MARSLDAESLLGLLIAGILTGLTLGALVVASAFLRAGEQAYAHLDGYAAGLTQGQAVARCQIIGYVGMTGNARASSPHLHFAVFELEAPAPSCFSGRPLNPYSLFR